MRSLYTLQLHAPSQRAIPANIIHEPQREERNFALSQITWARFQIPGPRLFSEVGDDKVGERSDSSFFVVIRRRSRMANGIP